MSVAVNLKFSEPLNTAHPVDLRFGAPLVSTDDSNITSVAQLAAPRFTGRIAKINPVRSIASMPSIVGAATLHYDKMVYRGPRVATGSAWQKADHQREYVEQRHQAGIEFRTYVEQPQQSAHRVPSDTAMPWQSSSRVRNLQSAHWQDGTRAGVQRTAPQQGMLRLRNHQAHAWQDGSRVRTDRHDAWQDRFRRPRPALAQRWQEALPRGFDRMASAGVALPLPLGRQSWWQIARKPAAGRYTDAIPPVVPDGRCYIPPPGSAVPLLFVDPITGDTNLIFICGKRAAEPPASVIVPIKRVYIVLNNVYLLRVDGNFELPAISLALNIDWDSWTWGFSAALPASALPLIEPGVSGDPVLLKAMVNGTAYLLLAEGIKRDRTFGKSTITVSGRGQSASLADPYSPILTFTNADARTAQQLMNDALTINGVSLGWAVDWRIDDWLVPAGVWSHQGTYMSAVNAIASAAGAFIQPDPVNKILRVRPRYPAKPWEWYGVAPDIELPAAAVVKESISWSEKPAYNAIYVSGTTAGGILGQVKRAGSAGDVLAPMITDALITDAIAARQRGVQALADTGRGAVYALSLPVLPESGVIEPGTLFRYVDDGVPKVGVVKGVSVSAALPSVRQTIEVETHG